jgi:hypothetical protein
MCCCAPALAGDGFEKVRCDGVIAKALIGRRASNERIVVIEARHKDIRLKDWGATEPGDGDSVTTISWSICGRVFVLLEQNSDPATVYDAIEVAPTPSRDDLLISGSCKVNGKEMNDPVVAVLNWPPGINPLKLQAPENKMVPATVAWRTDEKARKFVKLSVDGLLCRT